MKQSVCFAHKGHIERFCFKINPLNVRCNEFNVVKQDNYIPWLCEHELVLGFSYTLVVKVISAAYVWTLLAAFNVIVKRLISSQIHFNL